MQLKEEFRSYDSLRREHDAQIVSIALESKLKISAEQWSSLLYGDSEHKSHMQSILDRLQPPNSFIQSIDDFKALLDKNGDPHNLACLIDHLNRLAKIDSVDQTCSSETLEVYLESTYVILEKLSYFLTSYRTPSTRSLCTKRITSTNQQSTNFSKPILPQSSLPIVQSRQQPLLHLHQHPHPPQPRYFSLIQ